MNEQQYTGYFEALAEKSTLINHNQDGRKSFFYIENADDLDEFDQALRNAVQSPTMLLTAEDGQLDDNESKNYTQAIDGQFYIVARKTGTVTPAELRAECFEIMRQFIAKIRQDSRENKILEGKRIDFRVNDIPYRKVGPMYNDWYGYTVLFRFTCPFSFSVNPASWR